MEVSVCLSSLVAQIHGPAAAVVEGSVTYINQDFIQFLRLPIVDILDRPLEELFPDFSLEFTTWTGRSRLAREREIAFVNGESRSLWFELTPVSTMLEDGALLRVFDTTQQRRIQVAFLRSEQKTPADTVWLLSADKRLLYTDAYGRDVFDLPGAGRTASHEAAERILDSGRKHPGSKQVTTLTLTHRGYKEKMEVEVLYLEDMATGGHFYCWSRAVDVSNDAILDRLRQVFGVRTDQELARHLGASRSAISRARNQGSISPHWLYTAWEKRGASMDWLVTGRGNPTL